MKTLFIFLSRFFRRKGVFPPQRCFSTPKVFFHPKGGQDHGAGVRSPPETSLAILRLRTVSKPF